MILTLLILYHSKCVFISWNVYVILKQLVLRKRDPIIDKQGFCQRQEISRSTNKFSNFKNLPREAPVSIALQFFKA